MGLCAAAILVVSQGPAAGLVRDVLGKYSGGMGEPNDPYRIATAEDLNDIGNHEEDWDKHFILVNDVNLAQYTGTQLKIIGNSTTMFTGVFDGNDHKISHAKYHFCVAAPATAKQPARAGSRWQSELIAGCRQPPRAVPGCGPAPAQDCPRLYNP